MRDVFKSKEKLVDPDTFEYRGRPDLYTGVQDVDLDSVNFAQKEESPVLSKYDTDSNARIKRIVRDLQDKLPKGNNIRRELYELTNKIIAEREKKIRLAFSKYKRGKISEDQRSSIILAAYMEFWTLWIPIAREFIERHVNGLPHPSGRWLEMESKT